MFKVKVFFFSFSRSRIHELWVLLRVNDPKGVQRPVLWQTRHPVTFIFLTWVFKRAAGRAEGCKAASIWGGQVCDSTSCAAEQQTLRALGLSYNPAAAQTSCVSRRSLAGHHSSLWCKKDCFKSSSCLTSQKNKKKQNKKRHTTKTKTRLFSAENKKIHKRLKRMLKILTWVERYQPGTGSKLMGRVSHLLQTPQQGHILLWTGC